ncbi:hypothetical protein ACEUAI_22805 [Aeromonas veronii]|uniref:hypothetical protein n=1 Tax=Aeromonas hydrophila TaxID=644 RepID=UPI002B49B0D1|nr:hypothetical protein [Aeromonas hydrophila]
MSNGSNVAFLPTSALTMHVSSESLADDDKVSENIKTDEQTSSESSSSTFKQPMVNASNFSAPHTVGATLNQIHFPFEPYVNKEHQESAVKIPNNFRRTIDPKTKELIEADLIVLAAGICKKYGVNLSSTFKFENEESTDQSLTLGVMFSVVDAVGRDQLGRDFLRYCGKFGLEAWMYGEVIQYHGEDYLITGLDLCRKRVKISNHKPSVRLVKPEEITNFFKEVKTESI